MIDESQGDECRRLHAAERAIDRHDILIGAVEAKLVAVDDQLTARNASSVSQGARIGAVEATISAHEAKISGHAARIDMVGNVLATGFDIHPGTELRDAAARRDKDTLHTAILSDIRQAVRWGVATGLTLVGLAVIALILMNGPAVIGAVGSLGGIK